ncbi:alternative ribosome rescue aminoacyl-tRNA hydrolase ArfB [Beijerinckia indica]|uniref:Class I peptide chain release factor n=1 Tax=Beijerinckia indica subsp. indica (strain ATCC 9039 / DSM 1715 / NCIMB 8712) TaxID=395963 RepID=B2ICL2_BEII9|nr:alternative ribosome rescue aminoacyl-tRNA hydrolase ArfB [Beijerinckia indica]ACB93901.1 Class I peptide chain release factor [Beijerinckia indica subsp. indica ATCC 9039]
MPRLFINPRLSIDEAELLFSFARASGPGGQNVNKVESAVQLRFDVYNSPSLDETVKERLSLLSGSRITKDGILVIFAQNFRSQELNRQDAQTRLLDLIGAAGKKPKPRIKTRPSLSAKRQRVDSKVRRGETKRLRSGPID